MLKKSYLSAAVPIQTLVWLRIALGLLGGGDILGNGIYYHWYKDAFAGFTFRYFGFEWVQPLPEPFFSLFFIGGFLLGVAVAIGYRFRVTAPLFALCFSYLFLLEKAHYLNHAYLFTWLAWLLVLTPAWRELSWDVWRRPEHWSPVVPRWSIAIFPLLMGIVYFFGGIAKLNTDWLLHADPLFSWLSSRNDTPLIGSLLELKSTAYLMAWGGFLLDLSVAFLLLHKQLRWWALAAVVFFHATNHLIFNIGIFPYLSLVLSSLWFEPDWPGKLVSWLSVRWNWIKTLQLRWRARMHGSQILRFRFSESSDEKEELSKPGEIAVAERDYTGHSPFVGETFYRALRESNASSAQAESKDTLVEVNRYDRPVFSPWVAVTLVVIISIHLFLPLRHHLINGDVGWTEEGHRYSWRMMLRSKRGNGYFKVVDASGKATRVYPGKELYDRQSRKLYTHPDMILQYAHHLAGRCADTTGQTCQVYAKIRVRLNNGKYYPYIDETIDLAKVEWTWIDRKTWVLPEGKEE